MQRVVIYLKGRTDLTQPVFFDWWLASTEHWPSSSLGCAST